MKGFSRPQDPESNAGESIATGKATHFGKVLMDEGGTTSSGCPQPTQWQIIKQMIDTLYR